MSESNDVKLISEERIREIEAHVGTNVVFGEDGDAEYCFFLEDLIAAVARIRQAEAHRDKLGEDLKTMAMLYDDLQERVKELEADIELRIDMMGTLTAERDDARRKVKELDDAYIHEHARREHVEAERDNLKAKMKSLQDRFGHLTEAVAALDESHPFKHMLKDVWAVIVKLNATNGDKP